MLLVVIFTELRVVFVNVSVPVIWFVGEGKVVLLVVVLLPIVSVYDMRGAL